MAVESSAVPATEEFAKPEQEKSTEEQKADPRNMLNII